MFMAKLSDDIKEEEKFYRDGLERIRKYYSLPKNKREKETGLKDPPHEILMKRAGYLICSGLEDIKNWQNVEEEPIGYILIGIGTEILLKAIILKEDPKYFVENIRGGRTLSFKQCIGKLIDILPENFTLKEARRIKEVLKLIHLKRNNLVHLGFHQMHHYREDYHIASTLEFLFKQFFEKGTEQITVKLKKFKENAKIISGIGL